MPVEYRCPKDCGARYSTRAAAQRCPCQPTGDDPSPPGTHQHTHHGETLVRIGTGSEAIHARPDDTVKLEEEA